MTLESVLFSLALTPAIAVTEAWRRLRWPPFDVCPHRGCAYLSTVTLVFVVIAGFVLDVAIFKVCGSDIHACGTLRTAENLVGEHFDWVVLAWEMAPVILGVVAFGFLAIFMASGVSERKQ